MLHERGLAYQAESLVNYDPVDKTVLANEQVDANGCSWRSGAKVEKVMLKQWFLRIKEYQEPLLKDLDGLAHEGRWPEKVLAMQRNWIGKSEGATIRFDAASTTNEGRLDPLDVFTTRADTLKMPRCVLSLKGPRICQRTARKDTYCQKSEPRILLPTRSLVSSLHYPSMLHRMSWTTTDQVLSWVYLAMTTETMPFGEPTWGVILSEWWSPLNPAQRHHLLFRVVMTSP
jgi:uncharacterized ParB-like nuclease family protein